MNAILYLQRSYETRFQSASMRPPSAPKQDSSWLQLKEYEVRRLIHLFIS